jgi:G:T-mismatch repair DNA endonuclease (very short patch repair protein)
MPNYNYIRTEEHNRKISESKKLYYSNPENRKRGKQPQTVYEDFTKEVIKRKGVLYYRFNCIECGDYHYTQKINGLPRNPLCRKCGLERTRLAHIGVSHSLESRAKTSKSLMGHPVSDKVRQGNKSPEMRKKLSEITKLQWKNPEQALKLIRGAIKKPNTSEMKLSYILRHTAPHLYKYNGDGRLGVVLSGKIPDFVNVNGEKKVIELFGTYWHGESKVKRTNSEEEQLRLNAYAKCGYSCLIIWEDELKDIITLKSKIKRFVDV